MYGISGQGSMDQGTALVGYAAGHQRDEISLRIGSSIVGLGIRADRRPVLRIADQINGVVSCGGVLDAKAHSAHGRYGPAIARSGFRSARKGINFVEAIVVGG